MRPPPKDRTRTGFTTGACSAAAARAATLALVDKHMPAHIECCLPNKQIVHFEVIEGRLHETCAHAVIVKDAGDDPDCTDGAHLTADVSILPSAQAGQVVLEGGEGIGEVTLPGLGLEVGGPAINPIPRKNIEENVRAVGQKLLIKNGLKIVISVPDGQKRAKKTINARLGILGGISILGTTGIVRPYSTAAFRASVIQGIEVAAAQGQQTVVLTTGGRTERFVMRELPELAPASFVQMGDFLRYALDTAVAQKIDEVIIGGMVGKLSKMAQGETITHAGRNVVDTDLVAKLVSNIGVSEDICTEIRNGQTARFAAEKMKEMGLESEFHHALAEKVIETLADRYPRKFRLRVLVCDFDGNKIAEVKGNN